MTVNNNLQTNTAVDANGNSYTTAISNDSLSNSDFLRIMLEELKLQDPTKPSDTSSMINNQMQMSTIETNNATIAAMQSLQNSFAQSALASASNIIGEIIENGQVDENGVTKQFKVSSIESIGGTLYVEGYQLMGFGEGENGALVPVYSPEPTTIAYNSITRVFDGSALDDLIVPPKPDDEDTEGEDKPKPDDTTPPEEGSTA